MKPTEYHHGDDDDDDAGSVTFMDEDQCSKDKAGFGWISNLSSWPGHALDGTSPLW